MVLCHGAQCPATDGGIVSHVVPMVHRPQREAREREGDEAAIRLVDDLVEARACWSCVALLARPALVANADGCGTPRTDATVLGRLTNVALRRLCAGIRRSDAACEPLVGAESDPCRPQAHGIWLYRARCIETAVRVVRVETRDASD